MVITVGTPPHPLPPPRWTGRFLLSIALSQFLLLWKRHKTPKMMEVSQCRDVGFPVVFPRSKPQQPQSPPPPPPPLVAGFTTFFSSFSSTCPANTAVRAERADAGNPATSVERAQEEDFGGAGFIDNKIKPVFNSNNEEPTSRTHCIVVVKGVRNSTRNGVCAFGTYAGERQLTPAGSVPRPRTHGPHARRTMDGFVHQIPAPFGHPYTHHYRASIKL